MSQLIVDGVLIGGGFKIARTGTNETTLFQLGGDSIDGTPVILTDTTVKLKNPKTDSYIPPTDSSDTLATTRWVNSTIQNKLILVTGATAPQLDSSTKLATTEFVKKASGNYSFSSTLVTSATSKLLTTADSGGHFYCEGNAVKVILPLSTTCPSGTTFTFSTLYRNITAADKETNQLRIDSSTANILTQLNSTPTGSLLVPAGAMVFVTKLGSDNWFANIIGGVSTVDTSTYGYRISSSGDIYQWWVGNITYVSNATFPIAFPKRCMGFSAIAYDPTNPTALINGTTYVPQITNVSTASASVSLRTGGGSLTIGACMFTAYGY